MSKLGRPAVLVAAVAAVVLVGGCGGTVLDDTKVEETAKSDLEDRFIPSLSAGEKGEELQQEFGISADETVSSVDCPSDVDVEKGTTFSCEVTFKNGSKATETFVIRNEDADISVVKLEPQQTGGEG